MKLSVIIPVYNEAGSIAELISRVRSVPVDKEIIAVDDHSSDRTPELLRSSSGIVVLTHHRNLGKGAAIRTGLTRATGDIVIVQDADLEYDPSDYPRLLAPFSDPSVDAVYGTRFRHNSRPNHFLLLSRLANRFLTMLTNALFGSRVTDMETCYKAVRRPLLLDLNLSSNRFEIEPELTAKLLRRRARIVEVPVSYRARSAGKKIGPGDGFLACCHLLKWYAR